MACSPLDPLTYGSCAGSIARSVAGDAFDSIARSFGTAAQSATGWLWTQIDAATAVTLGGAGFDTVLGIVAAIAGVVAVALFVLQVIQSLLRRDPGGLARAVRGLLVAFLAGGVAVSVVDLLLAATDSLSDGVVHAAVGTDPAGLGRLVLGPAATAALTGNGPTAAAGILLLSIAVLVAVVIVYAALVIRKVLLVLTAAFAPLAFAGSLADITVSWTRRWIELTVALVFSKLVLVLVFLVGYFMLVQGAGQAGSGSTQQLTQVVSGVLVLALAGFAPWLALKVVHFTGEHAAQLHTLGASAAGGAAAAGRLGQKAATHVASAGPGALGAGAAFGGGRGAAAASARSPKSTGAPAPPKPSPGQAVNVSGPDGGDAAGRPPSSGPGGNGSTGGPAAPSATTAATAPDGFAAPTTAPGPGAPRATPQPSQAGTSTPGQQVLPVLVPPAAGAPAPPDRPRSRP